MKLTVYTKSVLQLLLLALSAWLIYMVRGVLVYIIIASILALVLKPIVNFVCDLKIKKFSIPRSIVAALLVVLLFGLSGFIVAMVIPKIVSEFAVLSNIDFSEVYDNALKSITILNQWTGNFDVYAHSLEATIRDSLTSFLDLKTLENTVASVLGGLGNLAIALFSIVFILFFFLKEKDLTTYLRTNFLNSVLSNHVGNILPKIKKTTFRYSIGLLAQMTIIFLIVFIGLKIVGLESALVIATFAAFINLIPYIGPMIGVIFGIILGLGQALALNPDVQFGILAIEIMVVFGIAQLTDNFISQPLIFSNSIHAHPLEIFLVISVAGLLGGIIGMVIAVPSYSVIRIIIKEFFSDSRFIQSFTKNV